MVSQPSQSFQNCQRIHVAREDQNGNKVLKIYIECHDDNLGWYSAGALTLPIHQLPLLQQALQEIDGNDTEASGQSESDGKIIAFPTLLQMPGVDLAAVATD